MLKRSRQKTSSHLSLYISNVERQAFTVEDHPAVKSSNRFSQWVTPRAFIE
jgi:hypothetical protein